MNPEAPSEPRIAALLRSYNEPRIGEILERVAALPHITDCVVVINRAEDRLDTPTLVHETALPVPVHAVSLHDYGWAKALNAGLAILRGKKAPPSHVLILSNEVTLTPMELDQLLAATTRENASCGYALFRGATSPTYLLPRNTCALWPARVFAEVGSFDESLDDQGGMEDYDLVMRAYFQRALLPHVGPRQIEWRARHDADVVRKLANEERAVATIDSRYPRAAVAVVREHCGTIRQA